ncbi:DUF4381 domain-containing protein [uncultured Draconibacterium sp.]|uniref:DUF4381 domain-containing protein n=1 Tax=uncultured Draconibacterium sp. TaxID=1573823 RepID=UPI00321763AC
MNETTTYNSIGQLIEPDPVKYSFNTPGWYLVLALLVLIVLLVVFIQYRKYRKNAYRREALKEIEDILQHKKTRAAFEINELLKRTAIQLYGRKKVAALYGDEWFRFLMSCIEKQLISPLPDFTIYTKALYNTSYVLTEPQANELAHFAVFWVKNHRANV